MTFYDRADELDTAFDSTEHSFFVVYGRRRVGKTELLIQFSQEKPHIYRVKIETAIAEEADIPELAGESTQARLTDSTVHA